MRYALEACFTQLLHFCHVTRICTHFCPSTYCRALGKHGKGSKRQQGVGVGAHVRVSRLPAFYKRSVFTKMALDPIRNTKLHNLRIIEERLSCVQCGHSGTQDLRGYDNVQTSGRLTVVASNGLNHRQYICTEMKLGLRKIKCDLKLKQ
jgi:hypothetical protein